MYEYLTERMIIAIQQRPSIWDSSDKSYSDRVVKQKAWHEVAEICHQEWNTLNNEEKFEKLDALRKKWKSARDYYVREKNRENEEGSGRAAKRRKICPYFDLMDFLKINPKQSERKSTREPANRDVPENSCEESDFMENNEEEEIELKFQPDLTLFEPSTSIETVSVEPLVLPPANNKQNSPVHDSLINRINKNDDDPNLHFLLSVLPEMSKMTERQNFEFRMEVMKALNKVKYKVPDLNPDSNSS